MNTADIIIKRWKTMEIFEGVSEIDPMFARNDILDLSDEIDSLRQGIATMNAFDVDQFNKYEQRITDLEDQLAEAQRHKEMLRVVVSEVRDLIEDKTYFIDRDDIVYFTLDCVERVEMALQSALDGGALEGDG